MRKQKILISALAALMFSSANVSAQDVYVDLSVLDSLGTDVSVAPAPLFPVVSPEPRKVKKVVKKAVAPKKANVKKTAKTEKDNESGSKDKVSIPEKSEIEIKNLKPAEEPLPDLSSEQAQIKDQPVNKAAAAAILEQTEISGQPQEKTKNNLPSEGTELISVAPVEKLQPAADEVSSVKEKTMAEPAVDIRPLVPVKQSAENVLSEVKPVVQTASSKVQPVAEVSNNIVFADGVFELSEEQKKQIDAVISRFEDPKQNKIAIFSYNYDDGEDVFRKKRVSLNRAVEIRSYLLGKGYKNFSIKVINVSEADKNNLVTIEELK